MRKTILLVALMMFVGGLVFIPNEITLAAWWDKGGDKKEAQAADQKQSVVPADEPEPKLLYAFDTEEEMTEFEQLYVAKQATFGRMGVLQAYFAMEQNNLTEIDRQMEETFGFKMDPTKMYDLNRETREIKEVGPVPQAPGPAPAGTPAPAE